MIWTNLLAAEDVGFTTAAALFGVYMAVFLLDELVIFAAAAGTMRALKLQERHGRFLKLAGGTLLLALGVTMAARPDALTTLSGTSAVFGVAAAVVAVVLAVERLSGGRRKGTEKAATGRRLQTTGPPRARPPRTQPPRPRPARGHS